MFKDSLIIFNKEAAVVFRDRRAVFSNFLLPLVLLPVVLGLIGFVQQYQSQKRVEAEYSIAFVNLPEQLPLEGKLSGLSDFLSERLSFITDIEPHSKNGITVEFPVGFDWQMPASILIYADASRQDMRYAATQVQTAIQDINLQLGEAKLSALGLDTDSLYPLNSELVSIATESGSDKGEGLLFLTSVLPYIILIYLFTGAVGLALSVTAGEKERGSLASLLVNQVERSAIALGKTLAIMVVAILNAIASIIGLLIGSLLFSYFMGGSSAAPSAEAASAIGGAGSPFGAISLVLIILSAASVSASLVVFIGSKAKTVREGHSYITPVTMIVLLTAVTGMNMDLRSDVWLCLIPFVNSVVVIKGAILSELLLQHLLVSLAVNVLATCGFVFLTAREFNQERVLFTQ